MRHALWHAPVLLLLYQTAPVQARLDELGRFQVALGFSRGRYLTEQFDCAGNVTDQSAARYSAASAQADAWVSPTVRVSAAAGLMRGSSDSSWGNRSDGAFGSLVAAREGKKFGIGGGIAWWPRGPGAPGRVVPSFYLRGGPADRAHFRIDDNASAAPGTPPVIRAGVAGGYGEELRPRWFLGMVAWPFPDDGGNVFGVGGELALLFGRVQPILIGSVRPRHQGSDWNLGLGARVALGSGRRP